MLEKGSYAFYVGSDVRSARYAGAFVLEEDEVTDRLEEALAPVTPFERMKPVSEDGIEASMAVSYTHLQGDCL